MKPNKASATAHLIAASTVFLSKDPKLSFLVPSDWTQPCSWFIEEYSAFGDILLRLIPRWWFRRLVWIVERLGVSGFITHVVLRKHALEKIVRDHLAKGFSRLVVLGAGFDTLALRLHKEHPSVSFLEVDFPATQAVKRKALGKQGLPMENLNFIAVDFNHEGWTEKLLSHFRFSSEAPTLFVIDGVLMYLAEQEVKRILSFIANIKASVAFTFMEMQPNGSISFKGSSVAVDAWLKVKGEVFRWGIQLERLPSFLESTGLRVQTLLRTSDFRDSYLRKSGLSSMTLAEGESICVAEAA